MGTQLFNQVRIDITFDGDTITLPVPPENLKINRKASNNDIDIIGLGPATRKGHPGLLTMEFDSFFPHPFSNFYKYDFTPEQYIDFINRIWEADNTNNKVARLQTWYLEKNLSIPIVIESFSYEYKGGDLDVWYNLAIKEYVPYGVRLETMQKSGMATSRTESSFLSTLTSFRTYTVHEGDTLFSIALKCTGSSANWNTLYQLNKQIIGSDGVSLKVGQQLVLPDGWTVPVVKSQVSTNNKTNTSTKNIPSTNPVHTPNDATANNGNVDSKETVTSVVTNKSVWDDYLDTHMNIMSYLQNEKYIGEQSKLSDKDKKKYAEDIDHHLKTLQDSFNRANKAYNNPKLSEEEKNKQLKEMKRIERSFYSSMVDRYNSQNIQDNANKINWSNRIIINTWKPL